MLPLDVILGLLLLLVVIIQSFFFMVPLGNENSTVRRLPWVTFGLIIINVLIYFGTAPIINAQMQRLQNAQDGIIEVLQKNPKLLKDEKIKTQLIELGLATKEELEDAPMLKYLDEEELNEYGLGYEDESTNLDALKKINEINARISLDEKFLEFKSALADNLSFKLGLAPNGNWKIHQLLSYAFMHGGLLHLFGNMIFFFAVAFSLEDLWGRGLFLGFYLGACIVSCLPFVFSPSNVPLIGASGAISGVMGAFLIRLYKTRIRVGYLILAFWWLIFMMRKKPWGIIHLPAYVFLPYLFLVDLLMVWYFKKSGVVSNVAHSVHIAGFLFGVAFAFVIKKASIEEKYINPAIEAKISFTGSAAVTQALDMMDQGNAYGAEQTLKAHLMNRPNDVDALMTLAQVYQRTERYNLMNDAYASVIRLHIANNDKESALYIYDSLLSGFPEDAVNVRLPVRDWMSICEYLREIGMVREAGFEYERLAKACPNDPLSVRACIQGAETALTDGDQDRAFRLFEMALSRNPSPVYESRIRLGMEKCQSYLNSRNKRAIPPHEPPNKATIPQPYQNPRP
ncbi:MAG: rhomboid family intramembrane serine protease [Acidobacteriota bacterium]